MDLHVSNFMGCQDARLSITGITALFGNNGSGKSSVLRSAAACATGSVIPVVSANGKEIVAKGNVRSMIFSGEKRASASLAHGDKSITINWSQTTSSIQGSVPVTSNAMSVGMIEWMAMSSTERTKLLQAALSKAGINTLPTEEELVAELSKIGIKNQSISYLWGMISTDGWDKAYSETSEKWSQAKGAWSSATGENYGIAKARDWCPAGWDPSLSSLSVETLNAEIIDAQNALEGGIAQKAVDRDLVQRLREIAGRQKKDTSEHVRKIVELNSQIQTIRADLTSEKIVALRTAQRAANEAYKKALAESDALKMQQPIPLPDIPEMPLATNRNCTLTVPPQPDVCPGHTFELFVSMHLNKRLATNEIRAVLASRLTPEMEAEAKKKIEDAKKLKDETTKKNKALEAKKKESGARFFEAAELLKKANTDLSVAERDAEIEANNKKHELQQKITMLQIDIQTSTAWNVEIDEAQSRLASFGIVGGEHQMTTEADINDLRARVENSRRRLAMFEAKMKADKEARRAANLSGIRDILAPDGLRSTKLKSTMDEVSATLIKICTLANWPRITFDTEFNLFMADIPFVLLSRSEQFRCQVAMQVLIARYTGAELLLIDGADILDASPSGRIGLVKLLRGYGITTIISMTEKREYAEKVAHLFDAVYWVAGGHARLIEPCTNTVPHVATTTTASSVAA